MFDPWDIIICPMKAVPLGSNKFNIRKDQEAKTVFEVVKNIDRKKLYLFLIIPVKISLTSRVCT